MVTMPYHQEAGITIYHARWQDVAQWAAADVLVTDPPYGIGYDSGARRLATTPSSIVGDDDTAEREGALLRWGAKPALVFGTWRVAHPLGTKAMLVWDQGGALGMGDLSVPWKPSWQAIYVLGTGFVGRRDGSVLRYPPVQSMASNGRVHPHQKPVPLLKALIEKCPPGVIADPFMGSGSTLVAAKALGRLAIGVEVDEAYCEVAAARLAQGVLDFGAVR